MESIAVIRADSESKVRTSIVYLSEHASLRFEDNPKVISPEHADEILEDVMNTEVKNNCVFAALIPLENHPSDAINKLKTIHPPAHIIIVTPRHAIFNDLEEEAEFMTDFSSD